MSELIKKGFSIQLKPFLITAEEAICLMKVHDLKNRKEVREFIRAYSHDEIQMFLRLTEDRSDEE